MNKFRLQKSTNLTIELPSLPTSCNFSIINNNNNSSVFQQYGSRSVDQLQKWSLNSGALCAYLMYVIYLFTLLPHPWEKISFGLLVDESTSRIEVRTG